MLGSGSNFLTIIRFIFIDTKSFKIQCTNNKLGFEIIGLCIDLKFLHFDFELKKSKFSV